MNFTDKKYYLFDGAMGTYYYSITGEELCENANIRDRQTILNIHKEYIDAGADAIKTNTFSANPVMIENYEQIIKEGCNIAKDATRGTNVHIWADIGPVNAIDDEDAIDALCKAVDIFLREGMDKFLLETFDSLKKAKLIAEYIHNKNNDATILISFGVDQDGHTKQGDSATDIIEELGEIPYINGFGFNCVCGPAHMRSIIKRLDIRDKIITVMPNAGYPSSMNGRIIYNDNPLYFAKTVAELYSYGVRVLGGCCGTTPKHIKSIKDIIDNNTFVPQSIIADKSRQTQTKQDNIIKTKLASGQKVIIAELDPPFDVDFEYLSKSSLLAKKSGADCVSITDSPLARARANSMMIAAKIKREIGIEAIPHITCRDKNRIGMKSALLGMYIENIRNAMIITGDPVPASDRETTGSVYQFNSYELSGYISALNKDIFAGDEIYISGALNAGATNFEAELKRAIKKKESGVKYFVTQPVFSADAVENIKRARSVLGLPVILGIMPVAGYKNAVFLNNEVTGVNIPQEVVDSFYEKDRDEASKISIEHATQIAKSYMPLCDGFMIMTQLKRTDLSCKVIENINNMIN
ncbi:MAG: bifunctional homocysteine S-methyltransferase/methylenetetrahydrofolate reductase [Eubacteriales bacterium]|nr:bifunctional homocysteine S-methyltransferase/methylenetetrahydrofolate reductase [Eubacteriales bacterium]